MKAHRAPKAKEVLKRFYCWYDYSQLIELIVMKLRYDSENRREHSFCVDADKRAEEMIECANYLEKASDDMNYIDEVKDKSLGEETWKLQNKDLSHALGIIKGNLYSWWD